MTRTDARAPEPQPSAERRKGRFPSGDTTCAAWHYPGTSGACVVMAGGTAVTKEPATDRFATRPPARWALRGRPGGHEQGLDIQLSFLRLHLLNGANDVR
jgi:hypothetical protein